MLDYLIRYFSSGTSKRVPRSVSNDAFVQAVADKLEEDINGLENKRRGVCTFKGLFYSRILTSLWDYLDCINDDRPYTGQSPSLLTILHLLERLCQWPMQCPQHFEDSAAFDQHRFPTLNKLLRSEISASPAILEFIKAKSRWEENALGLWRDLFEDTSGPPMGRKGPDAAEFKTITSGRAIQDTHEDISRLHRALLQHLKYDGCHCLRHSMTVNLESWRFQFKTETSEAVPHFRLFLTSSQINKGSKIAPWWQDLQVSIERQKSNYSREPISMGNPTMTQRTSRMTQDITETNIDSVPCMEPLEDDDLCNLFQSQTSLQQCLTYSSCFKQLPARHPERRFRQDRASIPLSRLIGHSKLTTKPKAFLSFCLVRMLWQVYDSKWINENWSKDDIHFMLEPSKDDMAVSVHEPFLQAQFLKDKQFAPLEYIQPRKSSHNLRPHRYPKLLALGIMLLEIELDQSISDLVQLDFHDPDPINTKHILALNVLGNKLFWPPKEIYSFLREVIELCIIPDYSKLEKTRNFRDNFLEEVVQPFDNFLIEAWPRNQVTFPLSLDDPSMAYHRSNRSHSICNDLVTGQPLLKVVAHSHNDYTVGWIAALEIEMAAARGMLDEIHAPLYQIEGDTNNYILGRVGPHKVVIACLPSIGNNNAAIVATNLLRSFRHVRIGLMVGIGGGVPAANDMRLGDIVVSDPSDTHGGVIQYDFGTATQTLESFTRKGHLNQPPTAILTAIKTMRANALLQDYEFRKYFDAMSRKYPKIGEQCKQPLEDRLYDGTYLHKAKETDCSRCATVGLVERKARSITKVHYGIIGSGNEVIRNAGLRDALHERDKIICFEMEAAGLMNDFPCIVIRGICDYCDSHKAKEWQPYAAGIAAAFAKELLLTISSIHIKDTLVASNVLVA